jgi:hypothetical protein
MRTFCVHVTENDHDEIFMNGRHLYPDQATKTNTRSNKQAPESKTHNPKCKNGGVVHHAAAQIKQHRPPHLVRPRLSPPCS